MVGEKLVKQDETPLEPEQGIESREAAGGFGKFAHQGRGEDAFEGGRNRHARVEKKIGNHLDRVVPAEVFQVQEYEGAVGAAERIVKSEVGGAEGARLEREVAVEGVAEALAAPDGRGVDRGEQVVVEERRKLREASLRQQRFETDAQAVHESRGGKAGFGGGAKAVGAGLVFERRETGQKRSRGVDVLFA